MHCDFAAGGFAFAFVEGKLVQALREGWWLLLDEINLAPPEVLERIAGLLEANGHGSLTLIERGDASPVPRHPNFRLVAAMNPATDAGKHDLPAQLRNRFTEMWVSEPAQRADLAMLVASYLVGCAPVLPVDAIVDLYQAAKAEAVSWQEFQRVAVLCKCGVSASFTPWVHWQIWRCWWRAACWGVRRCCRWMRSWIYTKQPKQRR